MMKQYAQNANITIAYGPNGKLDFAATFSNGEPGHKYSCGRRMWRALSLFAPNMMRPYSPEYENVYMA